MEYFTFNRFFNKLSERLREHESKLVTPETAKHFYEMGYSADEAAGTIIVWRKCGSD